MNRSVIRKSVKKSQWKVVIAVAIVCGGLGLSTARAILVANQFGGPGAFSASKTDLINTGQVSLVSIGILSGSADFGTSVTKLNDGFFLDSTESSTAAVNGFIPTPSTVVTAVLNTAVSPLGYDISSVVSLTGNYPGGEQRDGQAYDLAVHLVGGSGFITLASPRFDADSSAGENTAQEQQVTITGDGGGLLTNHVDQIQFTFYNTSWPTQPNQWEDLYREIDVFGVAAIPEPGTVSLALLGLAAVWTRRR